MPKINCPYCAGTGIYIWVGKGYSTDRYYHEPCKNCNETGKINIEVPVEVFKKLKVGTWKEVEDLYKIYKESLKETKESIKQLKDILQQRKK